MTSETVRVEVSPTTLRWARERSRLEPADLDRRFPKLDAWERGDERPTLKRLEAFAKATHTPIGYLFLPEPPDERVPIPDLRTIGNKGIGRPSPDLLDTIHLCQQRQEWYRDYAKSIGEEPLSIVGSASLSGNIVATAAGMRVALGFDLEERRTCPSWTEALRLFVRQADELGVLVMVSGVVGSNNHRKLDPNEFQGFALADDLAPLVFINGADTKAAQMFTLAHELAHIWLGKTALSDIGPATETTDRIETWCNRVAAELLVPLAALRDELRKDEDIADAKDRLARRFKVSTLVILRRLRDAGRLTPTQFESVYAEELEKLRALPKSKGGDFYLTQSARLGMRFARALVASTLEGNTLYRDAFQLAGIARTATFHKLAKEVGVA